MNFTSPSPHPSVPVIQTRQQFEAVIENILELKAQRTELETAQEREITAIREKYRVPLAEVESFLTLETTWAETWAMANPSAFTGQPRTMHHARGTVGFRVIPPRIDRASRKWTWTAITQKLTEASWGQRYLRTPAPEVNKEALLADRAKLSPIDLRLAGLKIVEGERFFIAPNVNTEDDSANESAWQEAA